MQRNPYIHKYPSLTAVAHAAVKDAPSGLDARSVADFLGKPYATLMSELSRQEGHKFGADLLLPIMDITGSDAPLHFLAREMGYLCFRLPEQDGHPVTEQVIHAVKDFGELMARTGAALEDGTVTKEELDDVTHCGLAAISAITTLIASMRRQ